MKTDHESNIGGLDELKSQLSRVLGGFSNEVPKAKAGVNSYSVEPSIFPVPELILYTLRDVMGWKWSGRGEKVRWTVYGGVGGELVGFELAKFGLKLIRGHSTDVEDKRIFGQLVAAIKIVEKNVRPQAKQLIDQGNFTMVNRYSEFTDRYKFFREKADADFKMADKPPETEISTYDESLPGAIKELQKFFNHKHKYGTGGFYHSIAMIDCYFSGLEHRLILMRAFSGKPLGTGGFRGFMDLSWEQKIGLFIDIDKDKVNRELLGRLKAVKDRIRNPFAHGGFENDKGAIFVHFPTLGAIPANFTDFGKSSRFSLMPVESENFSEICELFDQLDQALSGNCKWGIHRIIEAGVDPSFDELNLKAYAKAISGDEEDVDTLIDRWGYAFEMHANMDY